MKALQDNEGNISSGRVMAYAAVFTGCAISICSVVALFMRIEGTISMAGIGLGMVTAGLGVKAVSKKLESKN